MAVFNPVNCQHPEPRPPGAKQPVRPPPTGALCPPAPRGGRTMWWPGPCAGPPEPGAGPPLCGTLGSSHSGKDPPSLHATSLAEARAPSSLPCCASCSPGPSRLSICPMDSLSLWRPSTDLMFILLHPEDSWPYLVHPLLLTSLLLACLPSWMAMEASVPVQTHSGQPLCPPPGPAQRLAPPLAAAAFS